MPRTETGARLSLNGQGEPVRELGLSTIPNPDLNANIGLGSENRSWSCGGPFSSPKEHTRPPPNLNIPLPLPLPLALLSYFCSVPPFIHLVFAADLHVRSLYIGNPQGKNCPTSNLNLLGGHLRSQSGTLHERSNRHGPRT